MFRVKCPICAGVLTIDTRTRRVIGHVSAEDLGKSAEERFGTVVGKLRKERFERDRRLDEAKKREAERQKRLDELFHDAQKKAGEAPDKDKPVGPVWD